MASTSISTERPPSPPQSPPPPPPSQSPLRDPFCEEPIPQTYHWEARVNKRKRVQENQDKSLLHGFELKPYVIKILESNDFSSLRDLINDFMINPLLSKTLIIDSLALHYPNAFSFKLVKLLQSHPLLQFRTTIVSILFKVFRSDVRFNSSVLIELKNPLLDSVKFESDESVLPQLCGVIGEVAANLYFYPAGGWEELLEYVCTCVLDEVNSNFTKGLMLLAALPSIVGENREFWIDQGNYDAVYLKLLMATHDDDLVDPKFQEFLIDALVTLMGMSNDVNKSVIYDFLMSILMEFIDCHKEEESVVLQKIQLLMDLVIMDIGKIFKEKEPDVFWCMIGAAEVKEASEVLRTAVVIFLTELDERNMDAMKCLVQSFSGEEVKRVLEVAVGMISCFVEDPIWYEVDNVDSPEAGMTETFIRGRCLLNWLYLGGDKSVVIPIVAEMLTVKYACHSGWQARYAAMTTIGAIAQGGHFNRDMIKHLEQFVGLIVKSLDHEMNHQVVWATIHAIRCLSGYKELFNKEYHVQLLAKMAPIINSSVDRLELYALIAIRSLVTNGGLEKISAILEEILRRVLLLFKIRDKQQMVQLEAIETLQTIAVKIPITFQDSYYDQTIIALKDIMLDNSSSDYFLRAKCVECMANLVRKIEQDKFKDQETDIVMDFVVTLDGQLSNTDHITRTVILTALDQFCRCPKVDVDRFIDKVMPMLISSAQLDTDLTAESQDDNERYVEVLRVQACNLLSYCAHRSFKKFPPYIDQVTKIFKRWIGCSSLETRKASISAFPNILHSIKVSAPNDSSRRGLTSRTVRSLIDALRQETDSDLCAKMLKLLPSCILISGSFFTSQLVKSIADEIRRIMKISFDIEALRADEEESLWGGKFLPFEEVTQDQIYLILTTIETFRERYSPYVDDFLTIVSLCLDDGISERLTAISLNIFNIIMPHFPENLPKFIGNYIHTACHFSKQIFPRSRLQAARAIGICAEFGADNFKSRAPEGFARLSDIITNKKNGDLSTLCDTAVAALGKICEFQRHTIDDPMLVRKWLDFLPLKSDFNEAKYAHGLLSKMIQRSDTDLFGDNNENLPKIISIVKEVLSGPDRMASEEDINQMIDFIDQHGGMEMDNMEISLRNIAL